MIVCSLTRLVSPHIAFRPAGRYQAVGRITMDSAVWNEDKCTDSPEDATALGRQVL
jgi:hypothetical protein